MFCCCSKSSSFAVLTSAIAASAILAIAATSTDASTAAEPAPIAAPAPAAPASAPAAAADDFPDSWFYMDRKTGKRYAGPKSLEGKKAPTLQLKDWIGEKQDMAKLKGKIVVVDFWATWCGPCMAATPKNIKMFEKYKDKGLVLIGVHNARSGWDKMPKVAKDMKITYPLAVDTLGSDGKTGISQKAWKVSFWPTYAVIDHKGIVRAAGIKPNNVEDVVKLLMTEMDSTTAGAE